MKTLQGCLFLVLFLSLGYGHAQENPQVIEDLPSTLKDHVQEVFIKGTQDDDQVFMVLGFKKSLKLSQKILNKMVKLEELKKIGDRFSNEDHQNDFVDEFKIGRDASREAIPEILKAPIRSIQKIGGSFKVTIQQGEEANQEARTKVGGALKYAGYAVWAVTKSGYYLVIEAPSKFLINGAIAVGAVPFRLTMQIVEIGLRFAWFTTKTVLAAVSSGVVIAYSVTSATVGSALTFILKTPKAMFRPLQMEENLHVREQDMDEVAARLAQVLILELKTSDAVTVRIEQKEKKHKVRLEVFVEENGEVMKAFVAKLKIEHFRINLDLEMMRGYYSKRIKQIKEEYDLKRKYAKKSVIEEMEQIYRVLNSQISDLQVEDEVEKEQLKEAA